MIKAIIYALEAAVFYAISTPISKLLLSSVPATFVAAFMHLGAGMGVGAVYLFHRKDELPEEKLKKSDLPYIIGMIALDIAAPVLMMFGITAGTASNASLLGNFEIVATTLIALLLFKETVTKKLWIAIGFITASSILLTFEGEGSIRFSYGSLLALVIMLVGTAFVVWDTITKHHQHGHVHVITHTHNGITHVHRVEHYHGHDHHKKRRAHVSPQSAGVA